MNWLEACKLLQDGKKLRQSQWIPDAYITYSSLHNTWLHYVGNHVYIGTSALGMHDFMATNWEVSEWMEEKDRQLMDGSGRMFKG